MPKLILFGSNGASITLYIAVEKKLIPLIAFKFSLFVGKNV